MKKPNILKFYANNIVCVGNLLYRSNDILNEDNRRIFLTGDMECCYLPGTIPLKGSVSETVGVTLSKPEVINTFKLDQILLVFRKRADKCNITIV